MAETFPEDPTLSQIYGNVQLAESLASQSGRDSTFPHIAVEQEEACLEILRDRLKSLQKSVQVGLLDRYIRICHKSSVSYSPLPITGIKACLFILKVSTEGTNTAIQEKLAIVIENWRIILEQLIGPQIAGLQSIWTSKALCQLSGRGGIITTPSSTNKRKRSLENVDGAYNLACSPNSFPITQRPRASSSNAQQPLLCQQITQQSPHNTSQQLESPLQPTNHNIDKPLKNHASSSNEVPINNTQLNAHPADYVHSSFRTVTQPFPTQNKVTTSSTASPTQGFTILPKPKASTESPSLVTQKTLPVSKLLILSTSDNVSRASQSLQQKIKTPTSSSVSHPTVPSISKAADPQSEIFVSPSTLNLLKYWQHAFGMLDLAMTDLLEQKVLSPCVPLSKASSYYPPTFSPGFQWVAQPVPSYAPPPILACLNTAPFLIPQPQETKSSLTPRESIIPIPISPCQPNTASDLTLDRKHSNASTTLSVQTKLLTPVSPQPFSLQPAPSASVIELKQSHSLVIQSAESQHQEQQQSQCLENIFYSRHSRQLPDTPFTQLPDNFLPNPTESDQEFQKASDYPAQPIQEAKKDHLTPSQPSQLPQRVVTQPSQQSNQIPVLSSNQFISHITEAQKIKFVHTYRRVDATGKAKLEATLRKNNLWDHLSPLLYTSIPDNTSTIDPQVAPSGSQSKSNVMSRPSNSTEAQPLLSSTSSVALVAPSKPPITITTAEKLHASEVSSPAQSIPPAQVKSKTENKMLLDSNCSNVGSLSETSLDPLLSKMIIAMLAPEPQAETVLMAAFDTLGIRNNDAVITHLRALADSFPGDNGTFWKLRTPDDSQANPSLTANPNGTSKSTHDSSAAEPPQVTIQVKSSINSRDSPAVPQMISKNNDSGLNGLVSTPPLKAHLSKSDHTKSIEFSEDVDKENMQNSAKTGMDTVQEDEIEIIRLEDYNQSKSLSPSKIKSLTPKSVSITRVNSKSTPMHKVISAKLPPKDLSTPRNINVFQDDLPGFPDVNPSIQIQGTPARILARFTADQQMPPFRTFVPLFKNFKS